MQIYTSTNGVTVASKCIGMFISNVDSYLACLIMIYIDFCSLIFVIYYVLIPLIDSACTNHDGARKKTGVIIYMQISLTILKTDIVNIV